jgi:2'-deoxynucleoside 5'-phosphate N-hydrolase
MKIYFCGSIHGGRQHQESYRQIILHLKKYGNVLTEHVGDPKLTVHGEKISKVEVYERDVAWLREADVVIAEVSTPSLGVGYELGLAEALGKRILCLYLKSPDFSLSSMIEGDRNFLCRGYADLEKAFAEIDSFIGSFEIE